MHVGLVAIDGCFTSGLAALVDILGTAESARPEVDESIPPFQLDIVGLHPTVTTGAGFTVPVTMGFDAIPELDVIVVPAFGTMNASDTLGALHTASGRQLVEALEQVRAGTCTVAAACTGVFAVAETGLLDTRRATTSWWLGATFRKRYPRVDLDLDTMVVADERTVTAGAAFAHVDLALALVRRSSSALAEHVARLLVIDQRPSQGGYLAVDHLEHDDAMVRDFELHVRHNLHESLDVATSARSIGTSRRTLERRTQLALGMSPLALIRRLRAERAMHLLRTTDLSVEQIAPQVGYANASTLRTLLRQHA